MSVAIITGSSGLVGSEAAVFFHGKGLDVVGIDNNLRETFFGEEGATQWRTEYLKRTLKNFRHYPIDVRDQGAIEKVFKRYGRQISLVVHAAAQPSHDWAAKDPHTDFGINANGTLIMLESVRQHCPAAVFIFTSTNKVYGDAPNKLPLVELETRWEVDSSHPYYSHGINEEMSLDQTLHSLFGVSKAAGDLLTQEYSRYFGINTVVFRGGCLTGSAHSGTELHGFLSYLVKCAMTGKPYTVYGYKGKQVRDNLHSSDLINAFWHFYQEPRGGAVYNIGGARFSNCSVLEALHHVQEMAGIMVNYQIVDDVRPGDHVWWISDVRKFQRDYPGWSHQYDLRQIIMDLIETWRLRTI